MCSTRKCVPPPPMKHTPLSFSKIPYHTRTGERLINFDDPACSLLPSQDPLSKCLDRGCLIYKKCNCQGHVRHSHILTAIIERESGPRERVSVPIPTKIEMRSQLSVAAKAETDDSCENPATGPARLPSRSERSIFLQSYDFDHAGKTVRSIHRSRSASPFCRGAQEQKVRARIVKSKPSPSTCAEAKDSRSAKKRGHHSRSHSQFSSSDTLLQGWASQESQAQIHGAWSMGETFFGDDFLERAEVHEGVGLSRSRRRGCGDQHQDASGLGHAHTESNASYSGASYVRTSSGWAQRKLQGSRAEIAGTRKKIRGSGRSNFVRRQKRSERLRRLKDQMRQRHRGPGYLGKGSPEVSAAGSRVVETRKKLGHSVALAFENRSGSRSGGRERGSPKRQKGSRPPPGPRWGKDSEGHMPLDVRRRTHQCQKSDLSGGSPGISEPYQSGRSRSAEFASILGEDARGLQDMISPPALSLSPHMISSRSSLRLRFQASQISSLPFPYSAARAPLASAADSDVGRRRRVLSYDHVGAIITPPRSAARHCSRLNGEIERALAKPPGTSAGFKRLATLLKAGVEGGERENLKPSDGDEAVWRSAGSGKERRRGDGDLAGEVYRDSLTGGFGLEALKLKVKGKRKANGSGGTAGDGGARVCADARVASAEAKPSRGLASSGDKAGSERIPSDGGGSGGGLRSKEERGAPRVALQYIQWE